MLGFPPAEVDAMSLWQLAACVEGWNRANGVEEPVEPMTPDAFDDLLARHAAFITQGALH